MSKIVARIQAHPSRGHLHPLLVEALAPLTVELSVHSSNPPSPWAGYQQALSHTSDCSHLLVLQDDVSVCRNLPPAVTRIADANPERLVVLFLARLPARIATFALRAAKRRQPYLDVRFRINEFCPVVGVLWPVAKTQEFLSWTKANPNKLGHPAPRSDDGVLGKWACLTKETVRFTIPSLVQHPDMEESLIGRRAAWGKDRGRVALLYIGEDDPLSIDWS